MSDWPYVEDMPKRDAFAESLRIPLINSPYPRWRYITAVVVGEYPFEKFSVRPTDDELRIVASFHQEYVSRWYNARWVQKMAERPFDIDGAAVGRFLVKYQNGGWGYRKHTWQYGPMFAPQWDNEPTDLIAVMDRIHSFGGDEVSPRWLEWKQNHAELFKATS